MLDACSNDRDRALIAVAWDAGARSGELRSLTIGNVADHKYGLQITVDGKQGQRTITLIPSVPSLRDWLRNHPAPDDPDASLWSKLNSPEPNQLPAQAEHLAAGRSGCRNHPHRCDVYADAEVLGIVPRVARRLAGPP